MHVARPENHLLYIDIGSEIEIFTIRPMLQEKQEKP
jgi:hypothetical protein